MLTLVPVPLGFYAFHQGSQPGPLLMVVVAAVFVSIGIYVWSRPE